MLYRIGGSLQNWQERFPGNTKNFLNAHSCSTKNYSTLTLYAPEECESSSEMNHDSANHRKACYVRLKNRHPRPFGLRNVAFYVAIPSVLAVYTASSHRLLTVLPPLSVLIFCLINALLAWWVLSGITRAVQKILSRWRPPQIVILTSGMGLAFWIYPPIAEFIDRGFLGMWSTEETRQHLMEVMRTAPVPASFLPFVWRDFAIWIAANVIFDQFLGLPRFRYDEPHAQVIENPVEEQEIESAGSPSLPIAQHKIPTPGFLQHMEVPVELDAVIALKAEQHYISVYTYDKKYIVLYRFGDALTELPEDIGWQIHRSWWIRNSVLRRLHQSGRKMYAELITGELVPVSSPNQAMARKMASDANLEIRPIGKGHLAG